ncbi:WASP homolog-associated protein with actin, membranes and microtubules [Pseudonaja textilis]|uniref:WASP homolog associated with actin, golgi membranes and microtubules n=1 Tax=Pseudonaja textilis TaxID=8673 RepID=A0A670YGY0_PSETE|nr:WASP homolog-associated protein with actin, membranes and microtubules [Pseudonaja textilis]
MELEEEEMQPDSLEGWVAIKENLFGQPEPPHKLRFLVAWNAVESKFAVTCHNRTLQERAGGEKEGKEEEEEEEDEEEGEAGDEQRLSWAGLYSPQALAGVHRQLAALNQQLEPCFPALPPALSGPSGFWALLFPSCPVLGETELETLCRRLEVYFGWALEVCGRKTLLDALFAHDQEEEEEYFENLQEFRRKSLKGRLTAAKETLRGVLHKHKDADKLVDLMELYKEEDEAYWELVTVATEFYQYLLLPFRDMRELATLYRLEILKSLQANRLGPKRIEALQKEAKEWTDQAEEAVCSIRNITVGYFKETVTALAAMHKQMEQDQKRFGQAAWASASPRLENLKYLLAKETLQHMRARELGLKHKTVDIRKQMEMLSEQKNDVAQVEKLELEYYETQLELYEVQFEILKNEEMLLVTQLETLKRQIKEIQDEVIYYDTCENSEELEAMDRALESSSASSSEVAQLRQKTQQLETKRGIICARRAYLRNKKDQCEESRRLRLQQAQETTRYFEQHHNIQIKREKRKEDEKKKKAWIKEERQKTLERLKSFKEKCPAQLVLKTSRSQPINSKQAGPRRPPAVPPQAGPPRKGPAAKQSRSVHPTQVRTSKAASRKPPRDVPVQIFVSPQGPEPPKEGVGAPLPVPPPPPPLPPPPPPPPPPSIQTVGLKSPGAQEKPRPLVCEGSAKECTSLEKADAESRGPTKNYTGTMDEVLASLKRGEVLLRKVDLTQQQSRPDLNDSILAAIRQGVKLRKVNPEPKEGVAKGSCSELEQSIKAAIQRIKKVSADSDDDENGDCSGEEWNS